MTDHAQKSLRAALGGLLLLGLCLTPACDKNDPTAVEGSSIILSASPSALPATGGVSDISAVLLDPSGVPGQGIAIFFSTNEGSLASGSIGVTTDSNGIARDQLTTFQSAQVTAQSGGASQQVTVTVGGAQLVGSIDLSATTATSGNAPLLVGFQAVVRTTTGAPMTGVILSITVNGDPTAIKSPTNPVTDAQGVARFDVENLTVDGATVLVSAGSVSSDPPIPITITPVP